MDEVDIYDWVNVLALQVSFHTTRFFWRQSQFHNVFSRSQQTDGEAWLDTVEKYLVQPKASFFEFYNALKKAHRLLAFRRLFLHNFKGHLFAKFTKCFVTFLQNHIQMVRWNARKPPRYMVTITGWDFVAFWQLIFLIMRPEHSLPLPR